MVIQREFPWCELCTIPVDQSCTGTTEVWEVIVLQNGWCLQGGEEPWVSISITFCTQNRSKSVYLILACCTTLLCPQGAFTYTGLLILTKQNKNCYVGIFLLLPIKKLRFRGGSWLSRGHTACEKQNPVSSPDLLIHPTPQLLFLPSLGCIRIIHISEHINIEWGDTPKCWHIIQIILNITFFFWSKEVLLVSPGNQG